jgi:SAM-dependent methyltransferase
MNPVIEQIRFMQKIGGIRRLLRMRKKHALGLKYIRGYVVTTCFWTLSNSGFFSQLQKKGTVNLKEFARERGLDIETLRSICEYLDGIKILNCENDLCLLDRNGELLLQEPRGLFDLLYGYEPVFKELDALLCRKKDYGPDILRRGEAVAKGSGELGGQFPFLAVCELVYEHGFKRVLDLGCGDLKFLFLLCERPEITGIGIDKDEDTISAARNRLKDCANGRISVQRGDMFAVEELAGAFPDVDAITAIDVFHEYLYEGTQPVVELLRKYKKHFPSTYLVVAEFFKLPRVWLRRIPTTTLEHHLFHSLTDQIILPIAEWVSVFEQSGYQIMEKKLVHAIGHGYFVLK